MTNRTEFPRPKNFPYDEVFYTDGEVAIMLGTYKGSKQKSLGLRWMVGESELGYPITRGQAMWMVVPDRLAMFMLEGIDKHIDTEKPSIKNMKLFEDALKYLKSRNEEPKEKR